jgi:hypothetical protein
VGGLELPLAVSGPCTKRLGQQVQPWVGAKQAEEALFLYGHGTGSMSTEASFGLGPALQEITSAGGMVASFTTTTGMGTNTAHEVWYTGDFEMADIAVNRNHVGGHCASSAADKAAQWQLLKAHPYAHRSPTPAVCPRPSRAIAIVQ